MAEADTAGLLGGGAMFWLVLLAVLGLWMLGAYNRLTALRAAILAAWVPLEQVLNQRARAVQALLDAGQQTLADESSALEAVATALAQLDQAREAVHRRPVVAASVAELARAEAVLVAVNRRLLALVELHPQLRADAPVKDALHTLRELAPRQQFSRQAFNDAVGRYNVALGEFPTRLLGPVFRFEPAATF